MEKVVIVGLRPRQLAEVANKKFAKNGERIEIAGVVPEEATPAVVARACKGANRVIHMVGHVTTPAAEAIPAELRTNIKGAASAVVRQMAEWYGEPYTVQAAKKSASRVKKAPTPAKEVKGPAPRLSRTDFQLASVMPKLEGLKLRHDLPAGYESKYKPEEFEQLAPVCPDGDIVPMELSYSSAPRIRLMTPPTTPAPVWIERVAKRLKSLTANLGRIYEVHYFAEYSDIHWIASEDPFIDQTDRVTSWDIVEEALSVPAALPTAEATEQLILEQATQVSDDDVERELWADVYVTAYQDTHSAATALKEADAALAEFRKRFN